MKSDILTSDPKISVNYFGGFNYVYKKNKNKQL